MGMAPKSSEYARMKTSAANNNIAVHYIATTVGMEEFPWKRSMEESTLLLLLVLVLLG